MAMNTIVRNGQTYSHTVLVQQCLSVRRIFPVPHYNTCLAGIRAVAKRCGITKHITWHQSRHTAATTIFLSNGVPIETVSSMLGHKSIKTTQIYAKITKEKLNQDMENLAARLNGVEEFAGCTI
jgi:integrase